MCCRNRAPRAGGALASWQQPGGSFCSLSTLGDLAGGFDFRIQGEKLWISVFTTYLELEAMVHLPEFPFWAGGRGSRKVGQREWTLRLPPGGTWARGAGAGIEENSPFLLSSEMGFLWSLFSFCPLSEGWFLPPRSLLIFRDCKLFSLGGTLRWPAIYCALGTGTWASSSGSAAGDQDEFFSLNCGFLICGWVIIMVSTARACGDEEIGEGRQGMDCQPGLHWSTHDQQMIVMGMNRTHCVIPPPRS